MASTICGIYLLSLICILISVEAKHRHHEARAEPQPTGGDGTVGESGYCMKNDRKIYTNGWANTTMDIQYTKTVKIETSKETANKLREEIQKIRERYRRSSTNEGKSEKKKKRRKSKKSKKDKKHKQTTTPETATKQADQKARRRRSPSYGQQGIREQTSFN